MVDFATDQVHWDDAPNFAVDTDNTISHNKEVAGEQGSPVSPPAPPVVQTEHARPAGAQRHITALLPFCS